MRSEGGSAFVFLIGTGRCGSSLLHEILAQHDDVGFLSNLDDRFGLPPTLGRWNGPLYRRLPVGWSTKVRPRFAPSEGYRALSREVSPIVCEPVKDLVASDATPWLADRFGRFFERRAEVQQRPVFLHKFTGWPRTGFVAACLPDTRFVHVIRDGRAVANSLVQMPWWRGHAGPDAWGWGPLPDVLEKEWEAAGRSFPVLAALEWKLLMDAFEDARAAIPQGRWLDVRYEDFVAEPRDWTDRILGFVGLPWDPGFDRSFRRYRFDASRRSAYERDLPAADVRAIEEIVGADLLRHGYEVRRDGTASR
jgi:hypothetical protein